MRDDLPTVLPQQRDVSVLTARHVCKISRTHTNSPRVIIREVWHSAKSGGRGWSVVERVESAVARVNCAIAAQAKALS